MVIEEQVKRLEISIAEFAKCVVSLPENVFLRQFSKWSPRDVLAHLIGWNKYTIEGCEQIKRGETPFYLIDPGENFSKVNAVSVQKYSSRDKRELVSELETSFQELKQFLLSLDPAQWEADYGVRYKGRPVTIKNTASALIRDYIHHREQLKKWAKSVDSV
jgi:hypothetical protein